MRQVFILSGLLVVGLVVALVVDAVLAAIVLELRERREARATRCEPEREPEPWISDGRTVR